MGATRRRVGIVGAGLAGLSAARAALEAGADVVVFERGDEPGGAARDSAGWIWRYRDLAAARVGAPHGDPALHAAVVARFDDDLTWLEHGGVSLQARDTGRSFTIGGRIEPRQAIAALVDRLDHAEPDALQLRRSVQRARMLADGRTELSIEVLGPSGAIVAATAGREAFDAVVFAGGGYAADLQQIAVEANVADGVSGDWVLRTRRGGDGSSMAAAMMLGALRVPATGECLVRLATSAEVAAPPVRLGELQVPGATLHATIGGPALEQRPHDWAGAAVAWDFARTFGSGVLELDRAALRTRLHAGGTAAEAVRAAIAGGAAGGRLDTGGSWLAVRAGITGTRCGLRVDGDGRLLQPATRGLRRAPRVVPIPGMFAAGIDAADPGLGGIASGLALALVLGRRAGTLAASGA